MSKIKGIDLVTEGLLTLQKVIDYYEEFKEDRLCYNRIIKKKDGAAELFRVLIRRGHGDKFLFWKCLK